MMLHAPCLVALTDRLCAALDNTCTNGWKHLTARPCHTPLWQLKAQNIEWHDTDNIGTHTKLKNTAYGLACAAAALAGAGPEQRLHD